MISPKVQKAAVITIVLLLVIFSFLSGYGIYLKVTTKTEIETPEKENLEKEKYFDGKLWFYNEEGKLLGTYQCDTLNCDIGKNVINDTLYSIDYYVSEEEYFQIMNNRYIFLKDNEDETSEEVFLFDIIHNVAYKANKYKSVKNYGIGLENNLYIVENGAGKFGILQVDTNPYMTVPFEYDFIGVINQIGEDGLLITDYFVTLSDGYWNIMAKNQIILTSSIMNEIVTFNEEYVIVKDNLDNYQLLNYNGTSKLSISFQKLSFTEKYLNCLTLDQEFYVYNISAGYPISEPFAIREGDMVETIITEQNQLEIYVNDNLEEIVSLS